MLELWKDDQRHQPDKQKALHRLAMNLPRDVESPPPLGAWIKSWSPNLPSARALSRAARVLAKFALWPLYTARSLGLLILAIMGLGCAPNPLGDSPTPQPAESTPAQASSLESFLPTQPARSGSNHEPLVVSSMGFGQDNLELGYAFIVENPNPDQSFEENAYQVAMFDESGNVVQTHAGLIEVILPGQILGIADIIFLDPGVNVVRLGVQVDIGAPVQSDPLPALSVDMPAYREGGFFSYVTGTIQNPYNLDITNVRVSAVLYDEVGNIRGGGSTLLNFLLARGSAGVSLTVTGAGRVSTVQLFPIVSEFSVLSVSDALRENVLPVRVSDFGFGQRDLDVGFGFLIENPNPDQSVEYVQYQVTGFASDGSVIGTDQGFIDIILPAQTLGIGGDFFLLEGEIVNSLDVRVKSGSFVSPDFAAGLAVGDVSYLDDGFFPVVSAQIQNPNPVDVLNFYVSVVAYDAANEIIGGGITFWDYAPAAEQTTIEIPITTSADPARLETYVFLSDRSEVEVSQ